MKIRCRDCGHSETMNKELILTLLGGAAAGFGFWAWVSFLFAGTGFAMPLCIAMALLHKPSHEDLFSHIISK